MVARTRFATWASFVSRLKRLGLLLTAAIQRIDLWGGKAASLLRGTVGLKPKEKRSSVPGEPGRDMRPETAPASEKSSTPSSRSIRDFRRVGRRVIQGPILSHVYACCCTRTPRLFRVAVDFRVSVDAVSVFATRPAD